MTLPSTPTQLAAAAERLAAAAAQRDQTPLTSRMTLANVIAGPIKKPMRLLMHGVDGIGKSTFAACAPAPIFIGIEDGTAQLDVPRFPEPHTWAETLYAVDQLTNGEHNYQTAVIDTLDWLEPLCWAHVVAHGPRTTRDGTVIETVDDVPYGRGYSAALDQWRVLCAKLDSLRARRGLAVILIAHSWIKKFANPEGEDFDRYEMKLHAKAQGLLREWCDAVLFATYETHTHKTSKSPAVRAKGISTGARIIHTQRAAAFDAKNRYNLPATIPLDWQAFVDAMDAGLSPTILRGRIEEQLAGASQDLQDRVRTAVAQVGDDSRQLARIANKLAAQLTIAEEETPT